MPRFFFDVQDGGRYVRDEDGIDLPGVSGVWEVAVPMVDQIAKAKNHMHPPGTVAVVVRDGTDAVVYRSDHVMEPPLRTTDHDVQRSVSDGPNARPGDAPIGQTAGGLPDDTGGAVDITPEEEARIADRILGR